jgi:hypothetical protein
MKTISLGLSVGAWVLVFLSSCQGGHPPGAVDDVGQAKAAVAGGEPVR